MIKQSPEIRFLRYINKYGPNSCWIWTGASSKGYGVFKSKDKTGSAHRYSYELHKGQIPSGLFVCHHCDNPICVNPAHLFLGTASDNMQDKLKKQRQNIPKSFSSALNKISEFAIEGILKGEFTKEQVAVEFDTHIRTVYRAIARKLNTKRRPGAPKKLGVPVPTENGEGEEENV